MVDRRPVLLGMNNPLSADPAYALFPAPTGCTGHRIWQMLTERTGCLRQQYLDAFDRRNLVDGREWDAAESLDAALRLMDDSTLDGRTVVVLGDAPRRALGLKKRLIEPIRQYGATWRQIPHPSGRCRFYNDPTARAVVALLLEELYLESVREGE